MSTQIIGFEGIVGSGKTTQLELLHGYLSPDSFVVPELNQFPLMIEEIGRLKERLIGREIYGLNREDIVALARERAELQRQFLLNTERYGFVLMDRGIYSSAAFESVRVPMKEVLQINLDAGVIIPDSTLVFECSIEEALRRVDERRERVGKYAHRAVHETTENILRVKDNYRILVDQEKNLHLIDSSDSPQQVFPKVLEVLRLC